jgi:predicted nucleotidyltransferase
LTGKAKPRAAEARSKVAAEAASLLFFGQEKEYRQAKLKAAENLGTRSLPSNLEVALAMDRLAEETEGAARVERLIQMRKSALQIMRLLEPFCPLLIGSVWRGTIRKGSDIDIEVYSDKAEEVASTLKAQEQRIIKTQWVTITEHGKTSSSLHIHLLSPEGFPMEVVVRPLDAAGKLRK